MHEYVSDTGVKICVGSDAKENDALSTTSDPSHWWFHVAGVPGAHVVALTETLDRETKRDAAVLAVHHSKVPESHKMTVVDACRVRGVSKRAHSAHGLVDVSEEGICELTVFRNKAVEKARLGRLLITKTTAH